MMSESSHDEFHDEFHDAQQADSSPPSMEPLTPEEKEAFLARARARARTLTEEERQAIFGASSTPGRAQAAFSPEETEMAEMAAASLDEETLERLQRNFFPELGEGVRLPSPPLIRGVIFDFDYTLAHLTRPLPDLMAEGARAAEAYMRSTGMDLPAEFWPNIVEARRFAEEKSDEEQEEHVADDAMSFLLQFFGYPASQMDPNVLRRAVDLFYAPEMTAWRPYPGATAVLANLQQAGYKLAVLANYNCDRVFQRIIDYLGLRPYLDLCISSASVEYRKPDTRFFQLALDRWDALPYEVIVVGDSLLHDIQGGLELGALTVQVQLETTPQVQFDNAQVAERIRPDAAIAALTDLPQLVHTWATA